jgi:hypothetical protein
MAHGASHTIGVVMFYVVPIVHQELPSHMHVTRSRLGPGKHCIEEGRVPPEVYPMLLQQEKYHLGGRRQIHHHVNTRDQKKDKELGHLDQPSTSKSNDKKRKSDRSLTNL